MDQFLGLKIEKKYLGLSVERDGMEANCAVVWNGGLKDDGMGR